MQPPALEGKRIPDVTFRVQTDDGHWQDLTSQDLFGNKKVVAFSLPGAFTPTCSTAHVPRYNELVPVFRKRGIDAVLCISVNDTFVMNAWKNAQGAHRIAFVPDGNAELTRALGMLVDKTELGFGCRSWRYAMVVENGVIKKAFVEPDKPGDPYEVSDADTVLRYLSGGDPGLQDIVVFTKAGCSHCERAKRLLAERGLEFEEIPATPGMLRAVSGRMTTPQVFLNGRLIGGADDLTEHLSRHK